MSIKTAQKNKKHSKYKHSKGSKKIIFFLVLLVPVLFIAVAFLQKPQTYRQFAQTARPNFCTGYAIAADEKFKASKEAACTVAKVVVVDEVMKSSAGCTSRSEAEAAVEEACSLTDPPAALCSGAVIVSAPFYKSQDKAASCGPFYGNTVDGFVADPNLKCQSRDQAKKALDEACAKWGVTPSRNDTAVPNCSCQMLMASKEFFTQKAGACGSGVGKGLAADGLLKNQYAKCTGRDQAMQAVEKACQTTDLACQVAAPTATSIPSATQVPMATEAPTPTIAPTATLAPTVALVTTAPQVTPTTPLIVATTVPVAGGTTLSFTVFLHGIGGSGDTTNAANSLSNKSPQRMSREFNVDIYTDDNQSVKSQSGILMYNSGAGSYSGVVDLGSGLTSGSYIIKVKSQSFLEKTLPAQNIDSGGQTTVPVINLTAGDINGDGILNALDYNGIIDCIAGIQPTATCDETKRQQADLTDDSKVDGIDYNLFLRELSTQH